MWYLFCGMIAVVVILTNTTDLRKKILYSTVSLLMPTIGFSLWFTNYKSKSNNKVRTLSIMFAFTHSLMCLLWLLSGKLLPETLLNDYYHIASGVNSGICIMDGEYSIALMWLLGVLASIGLGILLKRNKVHNYNKIGRRFI